MNNIKLSDVPKHWLENKTYIFKHKIVYHVHVKQWIDKTNDNTTLFQINTPILHLGFNAQNIDKIIYRSHFLMSGAVLYMLENKLEFEKAIKVIANEIGYLERLNEYYLEKQQLTLF